MRAFLIFVAIIWGRLSAAVSSVHCWNQDGVEFYCGEGSTCCGNACAAPGSVCCSNSDGYKYPVAPGTCDTDGPQSRRRRSVPDQYYPHFDTTPDYLNITARARGIHGNKGSLQDNFYLVIGDQGGAGGGCRACGDTQRDVAQLMQDYIDTRRAQNPNSQLLFVLTVGDNFYWTGASTGRFKSTWSDVYSSELTSVPWFSVMGNHDYGNSDPGSACPSVRPRFTCQEANLYSAACGGSAPYSRETQGYHSNALNANKGGVDGSLREKWHAPDYTYFYSIPGLSFELIAMDWNVMQIHDLGGDGSRGAGKVLEHCGSYDGLRKSLEGIKEASTKVLKTRSRAATSRNIAIIGHYPDAFQGGVNFRDLYISEMPSSKKQDTKVFNFFGHTHEQKCMRMDGGECVDFMTGGSGGCCGTSSIPAGFVAISWDSSGVQLMECFTPDSRCTLNTYRMPPVIDNTDDVCPHTNDDARCPNYNRPHFI